jgi:enamine deaminase RidA (YjgF/YER057c/UK114 family)
MSIEKRIAELQIVLPEIEALGNYRPAVKAGKLVHISGQLPKAEGRISYTGRVGRELTLETARKAARLCVVNCLAALKSEIGNLDKVQKVVKLNGYITSGVGFRDQHKVMDAASELVVDVFGPSGKHARSTVGVVELPMGAAVEIDMVVEVKGL